MRLTLTLGHLPDQVIPINYQYLISSWIYKMIHRSDSDFAKWLHEKGYQLEGRKYKHFCFSKLHPKRYDIKGNKFVLKQSPTKIILSFHVQDGAKHLIKGVFQDNTMQLNSKGQNALMMIQQVQILPEPEFQEQMSYDTMTPISISVGDENNKHPQYITPDDEVYSTAFASNLVNKANAFYETDSFKVDDVGFRLTSEKPKSKLWSVKNIKVKGFEYEFELTAPVELQKVGYYAGFGIANSSLGMGMCEFYKK